MKAPFENGIMLLSKGVFDMKRVIFIILSSLLTSLILFGCGETQKTDTLSSASSQDQEKVQTQTIEVQDVALEIPENWTLVSESDEEGMLNKTYFIQKGVFMIATYYSSDVFSNVEEMIQAFQADETYFVDFTEYPDYNNSALNAKKISFSLNDRSDIFSLGYAFDTPSGVFFLFYQRHDGQQDLDFEKSFEKLLDSVRIKPQNKDSDSNMESMSDEIRAIIQDPFDKVEINEVAVDKNKPNELSLYVNMDKDPVDEEIAEKFISYCSECAQNTSFQNSNYKSMVFSLNGTMGIISVSKRDDNELRSSFSWLGSDANTKSLLDMAYQSNEFFSYIDSDNSYQRSLDDIKEQYGLTD